ncbi:ketoacyl-ACP synthase III family protein [Streptomyces huiliensis]|uniref:ketoacyl-ACP synthase III family protein n=1 Tax=Streptomyces huiliensis TaxID=2876027 RepID=UPI001CBDE027|nr:ketoacyl-ACP synthase III family protein [Streptomyces huiliensis]MBZ4323659.1 ketoacyl-ACP synthase III family protein [Streptomyces huiliensis]
MKVDNIYLAGVGTCLPDSVTTEEAVAKGWYDADERERSGMEAVITGGDMPAPDMAVNAARVALERSGHTPDDFGALFHSDTHHQGPDGWSAPHYVLRNTLDRPVMALEVRQGCLGMLASLELAAHRLTTPGTPDAVLLTTGDNFSTPMVDRWTASKLFILADGGAAAVVSRRDGFAKVLAIGSVSNSSMEELHRGGEVMFPPGITIGRSLNFEERSQYWRDQWAKGITPPMGHFGESVAEVAERTLAEAGLTMDDISRVCHVGFARGPLEDIFLEPLGIGLDRSVWEIARRVGHTGAADIFVALERLHTSGQVGAGDRVLLIGAATGMEAGCAVVEIVR